MVCMARTGNFICVVDVEALSSRFWHNIIVVDDIYLSYYASVHENRTKHEAGVTNDMLELAGGSGANFSEVVEFLYIIE